MIPAVARPDNQALSLSWDFDNRMAAADVGADGQVEVTYQFDALGRRIARTDGDKNHKQSSPPPQPLATNSPKRTSHGWGGRPRWSTYWTICYSLAQSFHRIRGREGLGHQTLADYPLGAVPASPTYEYVYASYIDEPIARVEPAAGQTLYFHRNQQYSIIALTDAAGTIVERTTYTPYGSPTFLDATGAPISNHQSSILNRITYTGREWDSTLHLHHFRARMYDPELGRFCGRDPIGYRDGHNLYCAYFAPKGTDALGFFEGPEIRQRCKDREILRNCDKHRPKHPCDDFDVDDLFGRFPRFKALFECAGTQNCLLKCKDRIRCENNCPPGQSAAYVYPYSANYSFAYIRICGTALGSAALEETLLEEAYHALTLCHWGNKLGGSLDKLEDMLDGMSGKDKKCGACVGAELLALACAYDSTSPTIPNDLLNKAFGSCDNCDPNWIGGTPSSYPSTPLGEVLSRWWSSGFPQDDCDEINGTCGL
ncbi:MAG: hypothetical protein KatS3mg111_4018 [Pirellulaceae bacterium]|nr:MAG: hypothetical protein KatS3mg111_4018 [Pirellulaceae bacterium]